MAQIVLNIPNDQVDRAVDALCLTGGYSGDPDDHGARRAFAHSQIAEFIRQTVMETERKKAMHAAMAKVTVTPITID